MLVNEKRREEEKEEYEEEREGIIGERTVGTKNRKN